MTQKTVLNVLQFSNRTLLNEDRELEPGKPWLFDQVRDKIRAKHYSIRTEETYLQWIKRYIFFHNKRHPVEMGAKEISQRKPESGLTNERSVRNKGC